MNKLIFVFLLAFSMAACTDPTIAPAEGVTAGQLKIGVDQSYQPLLDTEIYTYTALNAKAKIFPTYLPEGEVFDLLLADSIQAAVVGRPLNDTEMEYFKKRDRSPESIMILRDAICLIVHPSNNDTILNMDQLKSIFTGQTNQWSQINAGSKLGALNVVFDHARSNNARTIRDKFLSGGEFPSNCFAVQTNEEVINYVAEHPGAMGLIGLNWVSDNQDKRAQKFLEKVRVVGVVNPQNVAKPDMPRKPYQSYIYDGTYALSREVYYIRTGNRGSLGTGFVNYLLSQDGQLIMDRIGMVPKQPTERTIKITE